jgi:hypothetical protein
MNASALGNLMNSRKAFWDMFLKIQMIFFPWFELWKLATPLF